MATILAHHQFVAGAHFARPIPFKAHRIEGFSPETLEQHYEEIYGGAVRRLNEVESGLARFDVSPQTSSETIDLKAEERALVNALVLHEVYFDGLGEDGGKALEDASLQKALDLHFGGIDTWWEEIKALVRSWHGAGGGWIALSWCPGIGRLINSPLTPGQGVSGAHPIFALDMGEHAFAADFGTDRLAYADAVFRSLHWDRIAARFRIANDTGGSNDASPAASEQMTVRELKARINCGDESVLVLDVRHDDDRKRYRSRIMETEWRDSFDVEGWADRCPKDKTIVVYCMYGFWVSQKVAEELRSRGLDARSLVGGIAAWRAMGLPSTDSEI